MDYIIRVVRMDGLTESTNIECRPMDAWKVRFWNNKIVTAGDQGKVMIYDKNTGELEKDYKFSDSFITSITVNGKNDLVVANAKGELGVLIDDAFRSIATDHKKYVRATSFFQDGTSIVMASDDLRISIVDM